MFAGEIALVTEVDRSQMRCRHEHSVAPTDASPATKAWWTDRVARFAEASRGVVEPVTTVGFILFANIGEMQRNPQVFKRHRGVNASFLDGWDAQRIDWIADDGEIVAAHEPFWFTNP